MSIYKGTQLLSGVATPVQGARNIGQIILSTIPLTDAGSHLLNGALINGSGIYSAFVDYIASIYDASADYFTTEALWQQSVTNTGYCDKYVYDSTNNTVRLPKYGNQLVSVLSSSVPVVGNGMTLGMTNGTDNVGLQYQFTAYPRLQPSKQIYGANITTTDQGDISFSDNSGSVYGVTTDPTKSGVVADLSDIPATNVYYYVVVATSTKTEIEVDIDEIATDLNGKADTDLSNVTNTSGFRKLVEVYNNGTSGYKVYREYNPSTGDYIGLWCEQWGQAVGPTNTEYTVTYLKTFTDTNYTLFVCPHFQNSSGVPYLSFGYTKTASQFTAYGQDPIDWLAQGYITTT